MQIIYNNTRYEPENPSQCPHCQNGMEPREVFNNTVNGVTYSIWKCSHRNCGKQFVAVYRIGADGQSSFSGFLDGSPVPPYWPGTIQNLKSKFIETYMQALKAEYLDLDEIAGMGFRKSIEYLVKDYLIDSNDTLRGKIEDQLLAKVIAENFSTSQETDLKDLLQRATWLGNDMTHYLRYHENFDIQDLKELIQLVMDEIHSIQQKRHYIMNIQSKYKK